MKIKDFINNIFNYTPQRNYEFFIPNTIPNNSSNAMPVQETEETISKSNQNKKIYASLNVNLEFIKTSYNTLINSDILIREFILNARGKQYKASLLYIDGMVDSQLLNDFVLEPLMMRNRNNLFDNDQNRIISEAVSNNITVRKVKKFDLSNYLMGCLMPQNSVKEVTKFDDIANGINSR